jgi:hypothetical protein
MRNRTRAALGATLAAAASAATLVVGGGTAFAAGNSGTIYGGTVHRGYCDDGDFCIYTGAGLTGTKYGLPDCTTYTLSNWNGVGSWWNRQYIADYNVNALFEDRNHNRVLVYNNFNNSDYNGWYDSAQLIGWGDINFAPVWYIQPCGNYTTE